MLVNSYRTSRRVCVPFPKTGRPHPPPSTHPKPFTRGPRHAPSPPMDRFWQDLRFAARSLRQRPAFTAVAVLSLGLGIGANTAIFSLIHAVVLRALPVERPQELVILTDPNTGGMSNDTSETGERRLLAYQEFDALRKSNQVFSGVFRRTEQSQRSRRACRPEPLQD